MAFTHRVKGQPVHKHETVLEAKTCEQGRISKGTITDKTGDVPVIRAVHHETPCRCSPYDRCNEVRTADAQWSGNWRDQFRAYND